MRDETGTKYDPQKLDLSNNKLKLASNIQNKSYIEVLILSNNEITSDKIHSLPIFPKLHTLDLSHNLLESSFLISSLLVPFPFLRVLYIIQSAVDSQFGNKQIRGEFRDTI